MKPLPSLALALVLAGASVAPAEVIKRIDPDGRVRSTVVHTVPTLAESAAKIQYPSPEGLNAVRDQIRHGAPTPITMQRDEEGRISYTIPTGDPWAPQGGAPASRCGVLGTPVTTDAATAAYETVLGTLQHDPTNVECRLQLIRIGRQRGESELAISNDLRVLGVPALEKAP